MVGERSWNRSWLVPAIFFLLGACAAIQSTPEQEAVWKAMRACDRFPGVRIDRVEPDGRYWVMHDNPGALREFQACLESQLMGGPGHRSIVRDA